MSTAEVAILILAFLIAGGVKGLLGLGLPLVAVAILSTAFEIRAAVPLVVIPVVATNLWQWLRGPATGRVVRRFMAISLAACVGVLIGTELLFVLDPDILVAVLGLLVCSYVLFNTFAIDVYVPPSRERLVGLPLGLVGGVFCGAAGSIGPTVAAYLQAIRVGRDEFVQATGMIFFISGVPWLAALIAKDAVPLPTAAVSAAAIVPAAIGMAGGAWARKRIPEARFRLVVFIALFIVGLNLIRKGVV